MKNDPIFLELMAWGDFDIPITDSIWYKPTPTDQETTFNNHKILLNKMFIEFMKLTGKKVLLKTGVDTIGKGKTFIISKDIIYQVLDEFKNYLRARGYSQLATTKLFFTDGN